MQLANRDREFANYTTLNDKICELAQRIFVDETAIAYQNKLFDKEFQCVDTRFATNDVLTNYKIQAATCDFVKAQHYLSPNQLADPYMGGRQIIATYNNTPYCGDYSTWNSGCGCGCV